jgi:hypothetical protein
LATGVSCGGNEEGDMGTPGGGTAGTDVDSGAGTGGTAGTGGSGGTGGSAGTGGTAGTAGTGGTAGSGGAGGKAGSDAGTDAPQICNEPGAQVWSQNGHCYFPLQGQPQTWTQARDACAARNAHLVSVTSGGEQVFLVPMVGNTSRWIGLRRSGSPNWTWITGEPFGYTSWAQGEPNGTGECVRMRENGGQWTDRACTDTFGGICERP